MLFVTLRPGPLLAAMAGDLPPHLSCAWSTATRTRRSAAWLVPPAARARTGGGLHHMREIAFAGLRWELRVSAREADLPEGRAGNAWLFSVVGLLGAAMLARCCWW